ncbi:hypothetical protein KH5_19020 [Urechidicola sp. KH5]
MFFKVSIKTITSHLLIFISFISVYSQTDNENALKNFYLKNKNSFQHDVEQYLIHTNKDVFFLDELIWFKLYLINTDNNSLITSQANVYVSLFDSQGKLLETSLFLSENGIVHGSIEPSDNIKQGTYYLKVNTYKNQNEINQHFVKEIQIIDNQNPLIQTPKKIQRNSHFDINVYPNDGKFVINAYNQLTIKTNQKGKIITGYIIEDESNVKISKFETDLNGLASSRILLNEGKTYSISIEHNATEYKFPLFNRYEKSFGFTILSKNSVDGVIEFELFASPNLKLSSNLYYAVLERGNEVLEITAFKMKNTRAKLLYGEEKVNRGIYTISIFNPNNELVARKYFKRNILDTNFNLEINDIRRKRDSAAFNLNLPVDSHANISVSIIPEESKLLLNSSTFRKQYLLNTFGVYPGESKNYNSQDYDWQLNTFRNNLGNYEHRKHKAGIDISGKIALKKFKFENYTVMMLIKGDNVLGSQELQSTTFNFKNNYISYPNEIILSLSNPEGAPEKTKFELNENYTKFNKDTLITSFIENNFYTESTSISTEEELFYIQDITYLDEVELATVSSKKLSAKEELLKGLENEILNRVYELKENEEFLPLDMVINRIPGVFARMNTEGIIEITFSRNSGSSFLGEENPSPVIYIDDIMYQDTSILQGMQTDEFVAISVNPSGLGEGMRGSGGAVYFYTKLGNGIPNSNNKSNFVSTFNIPVGYANNDRIFENIHDFKSTTAKKYYSTIDWLPNIDLTNGESKQIMFAPNGLTKFKCIINGISDNGTIIAKEILIDLERKEVISQ